MKSTLKQSGNRINVLMVAVLMASGILNIRADEGMWIPMLLEKYSIGEMQEAGLRLSAEDIYSINQDCLKDALVIFGGGCTGEMISADGLLLTNHHCGYGAIQRHSSVENDYLTNGFWARSREEELPNEGLRVTYLRHMKDVTLDMEEGMNGEMDPEEARRQTELNMGKLIQEATEGSHYSAIVRPFYYGNAYYMFVYETFHDVRLVGAPPEAIGNFGADQDNWMWPRHTGDFSIFRVYADQENMPAGYDPSNRPYKPRKHLEIAAGGVEEGDFTMVMGYPGSTTQYLYSAEVRSMLETSLPMKIGLRTTRLEIMDRYMRADDVVRIQYASKYRGVSNAWKKWQGIILGLTRNQAVELKLEEEEQFRAWVEDSGERTLKYEDVLDEFARLYKEIGPYEMAVEMMNESVNTIELFRQSSRIQQMMLQGAPRERIERQMEGFYKNFYRPLDQEICAAMLEAYFTQMPAAFAPACGEEIQVKYKGDYQAYAEALYNKSVFNRPEKFGKLLDTYEKDAEKGIKAFQKDPVVATNTQFSDLLMQEAGPVYGKIRELMDRNYKIYMAALLEKEKDRRLYPDANFTMRFTYGKVDGYQPGDGVEYGYYTTLSGVMDKSTEGFVDYVVPEKLRELYEARDYGKYGVNGTMPVCFVASNHTSGGNSGSPVMDADGRLIGINFDRNWEGTMSDVHYDPSLCRNISVDIRYVLFIIDKFAGAGYLLNEMEIVW
ncbi:MAG: S46 family peptidase [Bacteroidales bacterium]|nr:S46 family peptidase [Bacteroidales bacterium]